MAPAAGRRLWEMAANTRGVLAVEWLAACQGVDLREGLTSSPLLEQARHLLREQVAHYDDDRFFAPDIDKAIALLEKEAWWACCLRCSKICPVARTRTGHRFFYEYIAVIDALPSE